MNAGQFNRKIVIQQRTQVQDATGQLTDAWADVVKPWAWVKAQSGMSATQSGSSDGVARSISAYSFRIRYRPAVTDDMRIVYQNMNFDIREIRHDVAGHEYTDIVCEQGGNDG